MDRNGVAREPRRREGVHDEAIARLQAEYRRLQNRIDAMYLDKLDGRIDTAFFDSKSADWRAGDRSPDAGSRLTRIVP